MFCLASGRAIVKNFLLSDKPTPKLEASFKYVYYALHVFFRETKKPCNDLELDSTIQAKKVISI
jgi:hypothetical protein